MSRSSRPNRRPVTEFTLGWAPLLTGLVIVAAVVLAPAWLKGKRLEHRRNQLRQQVNNLETRAQAWREIAHAVESRDPAAMRRLAWNVFGYKPAGTTLVDIARSRPQPIETWLPSPPDELTAPAPEPGSRWMRLATGTGRPLAALAGVLMLSAGLLATGRPSDA